jgi:hypothetical protein
MATETEKQADWFHATEEGFRDFGGVPKQIVFDNAKVMVSRSDWYDPDLNREFARFAEHYGIAPMPARPGKPKDKNLIEGVLGIFWRWIRPKLKGQRFFSLNDLNRWLRDYLKIFNDRIQRKYGLSRSARFQMAEEDLLKPLPDQPFEFADWKKAKVHPDCHIQVSWNFYSVPFRLRGKELDVRITRSFIEIFSGLDRVALHKHMHSSQRGRYSTEMAHLPESHLALKEYVPAKVISDAENIGKETHHLIKRLINEAQHPYLYLRRAQGIVRLKGKFGTEKVENASRIFNQFGDWLPRLRDFESMVKAPCPEDVIQKVVVRGSNPNLRGLPYWQQESIH